LIEPSMPGNVELCADAIGVAESLGEWGGLGAVLSRTSAGGVHVFLPQRGQKPLEVLHLPDSEHYPTLERENIHRPHPRPNVPLRIFHPCTTDCVYPLSRVTVGTPSLRTSRGKWYYEVILGSDVSETQIGWASDQFQKYPTYAEPNIGMDSNSWGTDGFRCKTYHGGGQDLAWSKMWSSGGVVGCAVDIDNGRMMYSYNGTWEQEACYSFDPQGRQYFPALSARGTFKLCLGRDSLRYNPPSKDYAVWYGRSNCGRISWPESMFGEEWAMLHFERAWVLSKQPECATFEKCAEEELIRLLKIMAMNGYGKEQLMSLMGMWASSPELRSRWMAIVQSFKHN